MLFRQLFDQDTWTYTYLIADESAQAEGLVDPVLEQVERDLKLMNELGLTLKFCLETHIHANHITGTGKLRDLTGCESAVQPMTIADILFRQLAKKNAGIPDLRDERGKALSN